MISFTTLNFSLKTTGVISSYSPPPKIQCPKTVNITCIMFVVQQVYLTSLSGTTVKPPLGDTSLTKTSAFLIIGVIITKIIRAFYRLIVLGFFAQIAARYL